MVVIKGPAQMHGTVTPEAHRRAYEVSLRKRGLTPWRYIGRPVEVFISEARLVMVCPNCTAGVAVWREHQVALCRECGAEFGASTLVFPDEETRVAVEDALAVRPEPKRNWRKPETPEDLEAENLARGLPARRGVA